MAIIMVTAIIAAVIMMTTNNVQEKVEPVVRPATQANRFYTGNAKELSEEVDSLLALHSGRAIYDNVAALKKRPFRHIIDKQDFTI